MIAATTTEMETNGKAVCPGADAPTAESQDTRRLRLKRVRQYLAESLAKPDALQANLGAAVGDLMEIAYRLKEAIDAVLQKEGGSLEQFDRLMPAIDKYLRLTRQADRFARLGRQLESPGHAERP